MSSKNNGFPSQKLSQHPGMVNREAISTVPTQGLSDPGSQQERARPCSSLALSKSEQIKSGSSGMEECREAPWRSFKVWKHNDPERMAVDYRGLIKLGPPIHALHPTLISEERN